MKRLFIYAILMIVSVASNVHAEDNVRISVVAQDTRQWKVEVTLESESPSVYCGFQMDMLLPDGVIYQEGSLKAGDRIRFCPIDMEKAQELARRESRALEGLRVWLDNK